MAITGETSISPTQAVPSNILPLKRKSDGQARKPVNNTKATTTNVLDSPGQTRSANHLSNTDTKPSLKKLGSEVKSVTSRNLPLSKNSQSTPSTLNGPSKPLKKGSYAEIMARGKAAHATLGQIGKIQHKKIERQPTKRDREESKTHKSQKLPKNIDPNKKLQKSLQAKGREPPYVATEPPKKIKKAALATTGYTGTARPKPSKSSKPSQASQSGYSSASRNDKSGLSGRKYKYLSEDDEEDEDEDEDDEDERENYYESDLSDMEAAAFEVDEEEETAAKIARREDAEALAEENRLKREKEAKRRKLAAIAKSRSNR